MDALIRVENLGYRYPGAACKALESLSFSVNRGSLTAVIGPAGAGKTTLAMSLMGIIPNLIKGGQLEGSVRIAGLDPRSADLPTMIRRVAYLHQSPRLHISGVKPTVLQEVAFVLENLGVPRAEMLARTERTLTQLGLETLRDRDPITLSGGETQRVALATVLILEPDVLILDEPASQLDAEGHQALARVLRSLRQTHTVLLIENDLDLVTQLADRLLVLKAGHLVRSGSPAEVFSDPSPDPEVGAPTWTTLAAEVRQALNNDLLSPLPPTYRAAVRWFRNVSARDAEQSIADTAATIPSAASAAGSTARSKPDILLEDVSYTYPSGVTALAGVNLAVGPGEKVLVVGRNGAGKSTLLKLFNGILRPTRGRVVVGGIDSRTVATGALSGQIALGFQDPSDQLFASSVREEVLHGPRWLKRPNAGALAHGALAMVGLDHCASLHPYDLHPAQRRFLALACIIAMDSDVYVLDEPAAGLSPNDARRLLDILEQLARPGRTLIIVSHDLDLFLGSSHRIILLDSGRLVRDAPVQNFFAGYECGGPSLRGGVRPPVVTRLGRIAGGVAVSDLPALVAAVRTRRTHGSPRRHQATLE